MFFMKKACCFNDPADVGNLISGSSAFSKTSLNIWNFMVHVLLKPGLKMATFSLSSHMIFFLYVHISGSSPGGSREFEGGDGVGVFGITYLITDREGLEN